MCKPQQGKVRRKAQGKTNTTTVMMCKASNGDEWQGQETQVDGRGNRREESRVKVESVRVESARVAEERIKEKASRGKEERGGGYVK